MKKLCALLQLEFFSEQDDTNIVNFDEGVWPFFWGNVIFKICPSISKVPIYVLNIFHCVASLGNYQLCFVKRSSMKYHWEALIKLCSYSIRGSFNGNSRSLPGKRTFDTNCEQIWKCVIAQIHPKANSRMPNAFIRNGEKLEEVVRRTQEFLLIYCTH